MMSIFLAIVLLGQHDAKADANSRAAIAIAAASEAAPQSQPIQTAPQTPPVRTNCGCAFGEPCTCASGCNCEFPDYKTASQQAMALGRPLVVFVGINPRPMKGFVVCKANACFDDAGKRIIVAVPKDGWLEWRADLPASASENDIRAIQLNTPVQLTPVFQQMQSFGFSGGRSSGSC